MTDLDPEKAWIGVDLDGTLAEYHEDTWIDVGHIGKPVPKMVERVKGWLAEGKTVKIFTARITVPLYHTDVPWYEAVIRVFLGKCGLPKDLEITNIKDKDMIELWDDRAVSVILNTGVSLQSKLAKAQQKIEMLNEEYTKTRFDLGKCHSECNKLQDEIKNK